MAGLDASLRPIRPDSSDEDLGFLWKLHRNEAGGAEHDTTSQAANADNAWPPATQDTQETPFSAKITAEYTAATESLDRLLDDEHYNGDLEQAIAVDDALLQLKTWRWEDGCDEDLEKLQDWQCVRLAKVLREVAGAADELLDLSSVESTDASASTVEDSLRSIKESVEVVLERRWASFSHESTWKDGSAFEDPNRQFTTLDPLRPTEAQAATTQLYGVGHHLALFDTQKYSNDLDVEDRDRSYSAWRRPYLGPYQGETDFVRYPGAREFSEGVRPYNISEDGSPPKKPQ